jgi:hypothetical protein
MTGRHAQEQVFTIFTKTDFQNPYTEDIFISFKLLFSSDWKYNSIWR